jgi:hypothetical protein
MVAANGDAWVRRFLADLDRELGAIAEELGKSSGGSWAEIERQAGQAVAAWRGSVSRLVAEIDGGGSER